MVHYASSPLLMKLAGTEAMLESLEEEESNWEGPAW